MKKSVLFKGLSFTFVGLAILLFGIYGPEIPLEPIVWGLGGAGIGSGLMITFWYLYYLIPKNKDTYEAKVKEAEINMKDERKIMLRDKSGRISYVIMFFLLLAVILIFCGINADLFIIITLIMLWIFMYLCGIIVYKILDKKL